MILGITGTPGAGKGAAVEYLVREKGFTHYSARKLFSEKMEEAGIPPTNRDVMIDFANALRKAHGPQYVFDELYARASARDGNAVIESIRTVGEAEALKARGGTLLSIDANQDLRYERIHGRGSDLDHVTKEEFVAQEAREMHSDDPNKQNIARVMQMADHTINNDGSLRKLHEHLDHFLQIFDK